jgi:hypothetical protein
VETYKAIDFLTIRSSFATNAYIDFKRSNGGADAPLQKAAVTDFLEKLSKIMNTSVYMLLNVYIIVNAEEKLGELVEFEDNLVQWNEEEDDDEEEGEA